MNTDVELKFDGGFLRVLKPEDAYEGYVNGLNDPEINYFLDAVKARQQTIETVSDFIQDNYLSQSSVLWGIWLNEMPDQHVGTVRVHGIEQIHGTAHIGICIFNKTVWGQKLGRKAIVAVTRWALDILELRWIEAGAYEANIASQKAFLSAGYKFEYDVKGKYLLDGRPVCVKVFSSKRNPIL